MFTHLHAVLSLVVDGTDSWTEVGLNMQKQMVDSTQSRSQRVYEHLAEKLVHTTDPAQIVVLESCLSELQDELAGQTPHPREGPQW